MDEELIDLSGDFSFTFEDETLSGDDEIAILNKKIEQLRTGIQTLLDNLKKDPDKAIIKWPNRLDDIKKFEERIIKILE